MSEQQPPAHLPAPVPPPPRESIRRPIRIEPVPDTPYGLAIYGSPPSVSGPAIGSLVAGIAAVLVSLVVSCFALVETGVAERNAGTGALVGGAFAVLAGCLGAAGIGLGLAGMRQTSRGRSTGNPVTGRGMAIGGLVCGAVGLAIAACSIGVAVLIALA